MHWSEEIAERIIKRVPDKEEYICAAGISPSGSIHIGNFRDVATSYFVCKALRKYGKKARLIFSWDEFDRFRKVPVNVAEINQDMEQFLGRPYVDVKDPFGCCENYAEHFEKEFETSLLKFGMNVDFRYQAQEYRSGCYAQHIVHAIKKRHEIFDILDKFRTQEATEEERSAYYPVNIYCPRCYKDDTTILAVNNECTNAQYECKCGYHGEYNFLKDFHCKLAWKIDWPMRWMVEGVDFEPGGKDHASPGGSYDTSRIIAKEIFGYEAPIFQGYEFIGIKGLTGKMSGSSGLNLTPETLLTIYQPEVIMWLYSKTEPTKAFNFCFDEEILRQYMEFDKAYSEYMNGSANEYLSNIMYNVIIEGRTIQPVPMQQIVSLGSIVDFNPEMMETMFAKIDTPYTYQDFEERLLLAKYWVEKCSPESMNKLIPLRNWEYYVTMSAEAKQEIRLLHQYLAGLNYTLEDLYAFLYSIPQQVYGTLDDKERKAKQAQFFKDVYQLLIGKPKGPRLYLFLFAIELDKYLYLLDFETPRTGVEIILPELLEPVQEVTKTEEQATSINVLKEFKPEIEIEHFTKIDLRVCKVVACEAVKKSRNLLKLTLYDGIRERMIMSSIKNDYKPEELIGRKIIIIANLKPTKLSGIVSEGMLLAGSANSCGCKVVFVDDLIPEGTPIC